MSTFMRMAVLTTTLTTGALLMTASPSQASPTCDQAVMCTFHTTNGSGHAYKLVPPGDSDFSNNNFTDGFPANDTMLSYRNRGTLRWCFYTDANFRGTSWPVAPGATLNVFGASVAGKISSARPVTGGC